MKTLIQLLAPLTTLLVLLIAAECSPACNENSDESSPVANTWRNKSMSNPSDSQESRVMEGSEILIKPLLQFTSSIFNKTRSDAGNLILSPLSIHAALNLVALGAGSNTLTDKQLRKGLGYPEDLTEQQLDQYHAAYKNAIETFKEISKVGMEALKQATAEDRDSVSDGPKLPVVDFFNTVITKQDKPLVERYSKRAAEFYNSSVEQIDQDNPTTISKVVDKINKWGKDAGFEQDILKSSEFQNNFQAMLISAVRVQGFWFVTLNEKTHKGIFYNLGLKDNLVDGKHLYISNTHGKLVEFCPDGNAKFGQHYTRVKNSAREGFNELAELNFHVVEIPLRGNVSFTIFEPMASGQGIELKELTQKLTSGNGSLLAKALEIVDESSSQVNFDYFSMPKFGFENDIDLIGPLESIGIKLIFDSTKSELSQMIANEMVYVDKAKHQAMIDVNKYGLKAAGVTRIRLVPLMGMMRQTRFDIEIKNPFMFMIRYEKVPLFVGQLVKLD